MIWIEECAAQLVAIVAVFGAFVRHLGIAKTFSRMIISRFLLPV